MYGDRAVYSVSSFNGGIAGYLERLPRVWVEGEVSELKRRDQWSLAYLTLKDLRDGALLPGFISRTRLDAIDPPLVEGDRVHVHGQGQLYRRRGEFRFEVLTVERFGLGELLRRIEEVRSRLALEGLFGDERKQAPPLLPRVIGLICGSDAAAKRDVIENTLQRYPPARFEVAEPAVQGPQAVVQVIQALRRLDADPQVDVIVIARGGGAFEDLLPFSDERLVRAVAECATPVVSAIGHEQDVPIVDLAADLRAGTPSLAAKLIVPDHAAELARLDGLMERATRCLVAGTGRARHGLEQLVSRPAFADPRSWITTRRSSLVLQRDRLDRWPAERLGRERTRLAGDRDRLRLLGPAATLERGYSIVQRPDGALVRAAAEVTAGERVDVRLARGRIAARVEEVAE
jgi:exodeoxyribonuclease VII large subunit